MKVGHHIVTFLFKLLLKLLRAKVQDNDKDEEIDHQENTENGI